MRRAQLDPVLVGGTLISVIVGVLSYVAGPNDVILSVTVGLEAQAITLIVDLMVRLERRREQIGRSGALLARIEAVEWLPDLFGRYADEVTTVEARYAGTIVPSAVRSVLASCESQLRDLARGHLLVDSYDANIKLELLAGPADTMRTTSMVASDLAFLLSEVGRSYWRAQREALGRGWRIERIFIYDDWLPELDQLAREQLDAGVVVKRVPKSGLPIAMQVDFTMWGSRHAFQQRFDETGTGMMDRFTVEPLEIESYESLWRRLNAAAEPFQPA